MKTLFEASFLLVLAFVMKAQGQNYQVIDLGILPGGASSGANAINSKGEVVGAASTSSGDTHAFLYQNGAMQDIGNLIGSYCVATAINDSGQVVGYSYPNNVYHSFLYSNGSMQDLGSLGGGYSQAFGINASGEVVGRSVTGNGFWRAFLYSNGSMHDLGTLGGTDSQAYGINALGQIVGLSFTTGNAAQHAFLYQNGAMQDLGTLGGDFEVPEDININSQVVGYSSKVNVNLAFLYSSGSLNAIGALPAPYNYASAAMGINTSGQVVGYAESSSGADHAFLYSNGSMQDLNNRVCSRICG